MPKDDFHPLYQELTGNFPFRWQERLFNLLRHQPPENWPTHVDLPTGLGKTSVIHLWLIALIQQMSIGDVRLPRRLVYVVDRRTVVDQATAIAEGIKKKVDDNHSLLGGPISVSTLRGQYADNRDWVVDPSRPAIIVGTVDMIGSRLLFSGYRSSYKSRPLDAGLLGQDSLLVLDEAHLSEPFAKLTRSIEKLGQKTGEKTALPLKVIHMSATGDEDGTKRFSLEECDLDGNSDTNPILRRFEAPKSLTLHEGLSDTDSKIVEQAASLAKDGSRVVVFVHSPDTAIKIAKSLCNRGAKGKKEFADSVEILTGTMRGLERDELLAKPIMKRFLYPENSYEQGPAILVSTSAGEVGFDLNADHLVCDVAPLDSIIQRLGRVNRRGDGKAEVHLFAKKIDGKKKPKEEEDPPKHTFESASIAALEVLKTLPKVSEEETAVIYDASPRAFAQIDKPLIALSPKPYAVELTDILLDAWSMTTVTERMPGRPPVGPWLRGVDEEGPQTTIAWRTELDLDGFGELDTNDIEEWFDAHRILPHETLTVPTRSAADWLLKRYKTLSSERRSEIDQRACIIDRVGIKVLEFGKLIGELNIKRLDSILDADVILPASFGGIERGEGLLDESAPEPVKGDPGSVPDFLKEPDVADVTVKYPRFRQWRTVGDDADPEETALKVLVGEEPSNSEKFSRFAVELPSDKNGHVQLISFVPKSERREFGTQKQSLVCHVGLVEKYASEIANRLTLPPDILRALELAAAWHDRGKDRDIWQRAVGGEPGKDAIGKSGGSMRPISRNYRHEFGSIRELSGAHEGKIDANIFDLAMHMIAAHHGRGRPHFPKGGFDPCARASSPQIATDAIRRFARLQRHYGHWRLAWLENLLRCADAMASAEKEG